ncbi:OB-fold nucleic acid binding domain-containing protein [Nocardioides currus]|uniref:DNA-binding protein n=1 Tax=Nocardioides currus TaxID=2133958 RepID=A0A2R7YTD9_9ACTN|nr:OB-fold nucleic acid binding domain-containing protein [Nocardioides currus]PUA79652.1 DNA-binding protein [Nocardioides currus]
MGEKTEDAAPHDRRSRLRRSLSRWADSGEAHARDLRATYAEAGDVSIADAPDRERVSLRGTIKTVTLRPRGGVPALEAELEDGSGVITIVWLGRRRIAGIGPGRAMRVEGRIGSATGHRVLFNPRYELIP